MKTYEDALKYLQRLCIFGVKEGLERINELTAALDEPPTFYRTIHVAGRKISLLEQRINRLENL